MLLKEYREQIIDFSSRLLVEGVIHDGRGNLSIIHRPSGFVVTTPSALPYDQRRAEDICVVNMQGKVIDGKWQPTSELSLHLVYYRERRDVDAVVHTHAPFATVFGIIGDDPMPMVLNEAAMGLGAPVPIAPYARPGSDELARITCAATGDGVAAILAHHGLVTVGENLQKAYNATIAAEETARALVLARLMGERANALSQEEVNALRDTYLRQYHPRSV